MGSDPLKQYSVDFWKLTPEMVDRFESLLDDDLAESAYQQFLGRNPEIIARMMGHESAYVIPEKALGSEFRCDFVVGECNSIGFQWQIFELKRPRDRITTKTGDVSHALNVALRQIRQRRNWLESNVDYASRPANKGGLGLEDIRSFIPASVVIGRRDRLTPECNATRNRLLTENRVNVMTYDRILDWARKKANEKADYLQSVRNGFRMFD